MSDLGPVRGFGLAAATMLALIGGPCAGAQPAAASGGPVVPVVEPGASAPGPVMAPAPTLALNDAWRARVSPRLWFAGSAGDLTLAGGPSFELATLKLDAPKLSPALELTIRQVPKEGVVVGRPSLIFAASGALTSAESSVTLGAGGQFGTLAVAPGDRVDASVDWATFQIAGGQVWRLADLSPKGAAPGTTSIDLAGLIGLRAHHQRFELASNGTTLSEKQAWIEGLLQARLEIRLNSQFSAEVNASLAWAPDRFGGDIDSLFTFTPWRGERGQSLSLQIGYRLLATDYEVDRRGGTTAFNGSLAGLYAGVGLKF